ncbi:hypothetical protein ACJIZ3_002155 [Penstemon smallii]|uniref:Photosystem I reaction center subunit N, chloroplastic n=1 Tax=Penstemon smallii TaxID=265156 RepID=A0ABD3U6T5_9LAMI
MAAMNSSVLACNYAISGADLNSKVNPMPSTATPLAPVQKLPVIRSQQTKELNDKKRLATSGANFARANTVLFGTCKFPENFTGCQDLAKLKKVPFISEDIELECKGKDKYKCGSNVFWKW